MRIFVILLSFFLASEGSAMTPEQHAVPTNRSTLKGGAWFPYVIGKIAPLEWWSYQESITDIKREEYRSDWSYQLARQNTWEFPRFCFSMFRPSAESVRALVSAVKEYEGAVAWVVHDDCIGARKAKPTSYGLIMLPPDKAMSREEIEKLFAARARYGVKARNRFEPGAPLAAEDMPDPAEKIEITREQLLSIIDEALRVRGMI